MTEPNENTQADENTQQAETPPNNDWQLERKIVEVLKSCYDPEIPVNIYELGLIYRIEAPQSGDVKISMTLTSPMCPVAESLPPEVEQKIKQVEGVNSALVELTWDPPWSPEKMSEAAKLELNLP